MSQIPKKLQAILWSTNIHQLDLERDRTYIIHQILKYGTFADIQWLFKTYSKKNVNHVFINKPSKSYPKPLFQFVKNYILGLKNNDLDEDAYTTSISGPIRQRATSSL